MVGVEVDTDNAGIFARLDEDFRHAHRHEHWPALAVFQKTVIDRLPVLLVAGEISADRCPQGFMTVGKPDTLEGKILAVFREGVRKTKPKRRREYPKSKYLALIPIQKRSHTRPVQKCDFTLPAGLTFSQVMLEWCALY
jgi:hypothetical protein